MSKTPATIHADWERTLELANRLDIVFGITLEAIVGRVNGLPGAANLDSAGQGKGGHGDPVANAAIERDDARTDLRQMERDVNAYGMLVERMYRIAMAYRPRSASALEKLEAERQEWPTCDTCARIEISKGIPKREPARTRKKVDVEIVGKAKALHLCSWCRQFYKDQKRIPSLSEQDTHVRGGTVYLNAS